MRRLYLGPLLLVLVAPLPCSSPSAGAAPRPGLLLPDLRQLPPAHPRVMQGRLPGSARFVVGFSSSVVNVGAGPLVVVGSRATAKGWMRADQLVHAAISAPVTVPGVGTIRYVRRRDHAHWHLLPFETYELRRAGDPAAALRARKVGFCLGDGFEAQLTRTLPGKPPKPVFKGCGRNSRDLLRLVEGISVGYGDVYTPTLTGQSFDVSALAAGEYVVVHRVNPDRLLRESDYGNNAASLRLRLSWPDGRSARPRVTVLRSCPGREDCRRAARRSRAMPATAS